MRTTPMERLNAALEGRYTIERELGEGGMATVYLADDLKHQVTAHAYGFVAVGDTRPTSVPCPTLPFRTRDPRPDGAFAE